MFDLKKFPNSPKALWDQFYQFTQIPRASKKEEKIREYILSFAKEHNLESVVDDVGNVIVYLPGRGKNKKSSPVIIQNHMDMVCDKLPDYTHNFDTDPLSVFEEKGWLRAKGTTLGADNGIGCAAALALITEEGIDHPPLELLFTVDEETGLHGALGLESKYLKGRRLINLDTEEWGAAYIGCAGGIDYNFDGNFLLDESCKANLILKVSGLKGGHSGLDIHRGRANAIKLISEVFVEAKDLGLQLSSFDGGKAHNIIPRDAKASFYLPEENRQIFAEVLNRKREEWKTYLNSEDQSFKIDLEKSEIIGCLSVNDTKRFISMLSLFPHGAQTYNWSSLEPLVNFSNNMAIVRVMNGELYMQASLRFFDRNEVKSLEQKMNSLADSFDLKVRVEGEYPSWKPDFNNPLIDKLKAVYKKHFRGELKIKAIHAGLECGILKDKIGDDLLAISFGPNITGAHSPTESLEIDSTNKFWQLLISFLREL